MSHEHQHKQPNQTSFVNDALALKICTVEIYVSTIVVASAASPVVVSLVVVSSVVPFGIVNRTTSHQQGYQIIIKIQGHIWLTWNMDPLITLITTESCIRIWHTDGNKLHIKTWVVLQYILYSDLRPQSRWKSRDNHRKNRWSNVKLPFGWTRVNFTFYLEYKYYTS